MLNVEKEPKGIRVTKNRDFGITGFIETYYDPTNRRIFQANVGDQTVYSWDHKDIKVPQDQAKNLDEFRLQDGVQEHECQPF